MQHHDTTNTPQDDFPDLDSLLDDFETPIQTSPPPVPLTREQRSAIALRSMPKRLRTFKRTLRLRRKLKRKQQREWDKFIQKMQDYSEDSFSFDRPARDEDRDNPYNYGSRPSTRAAEPNDITPAAEEFKGVVDLFDPRLFPAQNSKKYSDKSGREFLADFTKATRGQLVISMSRLAKTNPIQFAKLWIEMEKFNTPQQAAVDVNADINMRSALYAKLDAMSGPMTPDADTQSVPYELDEYGNPIPADDFQEENPDDTADLSDEADTGDDTDDTDDQDYPYDTAEDTADDIPEDAAADEPDLDLEEFPDTDSPANVQPPADETPAQQNR